MKLCFLSTLLLVVVFHHTYGGLLGEVRGILRTATNGLAGQASRLGKLVQRLNNKRHQGNDTVILDVTLDSLTETIAYLTSENEQLRATNAELRAMSRKQKQWLSIVRRDLSIRLDEAAKLHAVDKEELRKRLVNEYQQEIATIKQEMKQQLEKMDTEAKHQQIQQKKQIAELEAMKLASSKSLTEIKRELREKETAMNSLIEKTAVVTEKLKREQQANDELMKELTKQKQQVKDQPSKDAAKRDASSIAAEEKVGVRNSIEKNAPIDREPINDAKSSGSTTKLSSGSSAFPPKPKTVSKSNGSRNPKPRSSSSSSKGKK